MDRELEAMIGLGRAVRDRVGAGMSEGGRDANENPERGAPGEAGAHASWAAPAHAGAGDLQYEIDRFSEEGLAQEVFERFRGLGAIRLLSEGLPHEGVRIASGERGRLLVVDPIDGTRGLMHDKRSAFFLAALAPDGPAPRLSEVTHAVMVEIPTTRSPRSDVLAAGRTGELVALTEDLDRGISRAFELRPSRAADLRHGFGTVVRFFGGAAATLGRVHDELLRRLFPDDVAARQDVFEDQYISNGGQLHALMTGRDRFVADLRPLVRTAEGAPVRCGHPYDLCTTLLAERAGVIVTAPEGSPLDAPLDLVTRVAWVGYANEDLRRAVEPHLQATLRELGLLA